MHTGVFIHLLTYTYIMLHRSVMNKSREYPIAVTKKSKGFPSLRINGVQVHPEDAAAAEFDLLVGSIARHCDVFADTATDSQARLLQHPEDYRRAALVAHPERVHQNIPVVFVVVNIKSHKLEMTVVGIDSYVRHHMLLGMDHVVVYITEHIILLSENHLIKVRMW